MLRSRFHGEVTVLGGVPGDDRGVLATVRLPEPENQSEDDVTGDCERTRLERVITDAAGTTRVDGELLAVCPGAEGATVEQGDVDGDGRLELVFVSPIVLYTTSESRSGPGAVAGTVRRAVITDTSLRPQAELVLSERLEDTEGADEPSTFTRVTLTDEDGDGRRDLQLDVRRVSSYCDADDPWSLTEDDEAECYPEDSRTTRAYDAAADEWRDE